MKPACTALLLPRRQLRQLLILPLLLRHRRTGTLLSRSPLWKWQMRPIWPLSRWFRRHYGETQDSIHHYLSNAVSVDIQRRLAQEEACVGSHHASASHRSGEHVSASKGSSDRHGCASPCVYLAFQCYPAAPSHRRFV